MVLLLERTGSLIDLRRTQRRVAALLLNDTHVKLQKFRLRRRTLHQSMCHVCSRVDPGGIFRIPNGYLYKKGFFNSVDHLDNALQTTIVHVPEGRPKTDCKDDTSFCDSEENQPEKISVTIRRGSKSTKQPSPLKQEKTRDSFGSRISNYKQQTNGILIQREATDNTSKISLPPLTQDRSSRLSSKSFNTTKKSSAARTASVELTCLSGKSPFMSGTLLPEGMNDLMSDGDRITIIPTGFDDKSVISGLSTFNEGTTPSKSSDDLDSKFASGEERSLLSKHSFTTLQSKESPGTIPTRRSVTPGGKHSLSTLQGKWSRTTNSKRKSSPFDQSMEVDIVSDNVDVAKNTFFSPQPLVRENAMIPEEREVLKRPKAGHQRERMLYVTSDRSTSTIPTISGLQNDDDQLINEKDEQQSENFEHVLEGVKTEMGDYSEIGSSKDISEDATIIFSERTADSLIQPSRRESVCMCSSTLREKMSSQNLCKVCGKSYRLDSVMHVMVKSGISQLIHNSRADNDTRASSSTRCLSTRQQMLQNDITNLNRRSKTTLDEDHVTRVYTSSGTSTDDGKIRRISRSKTSLDDDTINRTKISSESTSEENHVTRMNIRSKQAIDEDYMDLDSIIYEDDGRYWSSGEESISPNSWYRHAHPFPLVNPDVHKLVYMQALKAARLQGSKKKLEDIDEMIRRPNVFSYIPLLPIKGKAQPEDLGLRPYRSNKPKKGQLMKHIFGDVKLDDFYEGLINKNNSDVIVEQSSNEADVDKNVSANVPARAI